MKYARQVKFFLHWIRDHEEERVSKLFIYEEGDTPLGVGGSVELPLPKNIILEFFGSKMIGDNNYENLLTSSTMGGYKSALVNWYKVNNMSAEWPAAELKEFSSGYKKTEAIAKEKGHMSSYEGKRQISIETYRALLKHSMSLKMETSQYHLHTCFLSLCFNLMSRSINIAHLSYSNITWENDALVVTFQKTKSDQEGDNVSSKRVFANPDDPLVCPILHLGLKIICSEKLDKDINTVFSSPDVAASKFSVWLQNLFKGILSPSELKELGILAHELGTHSFRKGAASWAAAFFGVSMTAIYLRAGWTIGVVQIRYIFLAVFSDSNIGRILACLKWNSAEFAALPPRFLPGVVTSDDWEAMVPGYNLYPACFQEAIPKLVASVIHHHEWLEDNLHPDHPYFQSYIYRNQIGPKLKEKVLTGIESCDITGIRAAGVPDCVYLTMKVDKLASQFETMEQNSIARDKKRSLEADLVAEAALRVQRESEKNILNAIGDSPKMITEEMLAHFEVNGAIPVTRDEIVRIQKAEQAKQLEVLGDLQRQIIGMKDDILQKLTAPSPQNNQEDEENENGSDSGGLSTTSPWKKYVYETKTVNTVCGLRTTTVSYWLPKDYKFKAMTTKNLWDSWIHGSVADNIPPFWYLMVGNERDCINRTQAGNLSKMKYIMEILLKEAERLKLPGLLELTEKTESNNVFQKCFSSVMKIDPKSKTRYAELGYKTVYNKLSEADPDPKRRKKKKTSPN